MIAQLLSPKVRVAFGWFLLIGASIGWPLSFWLTDEPPVILSLSWGAIWIEGYNALQIANDAG